MLKRRSAALRPNKNRRDRGEVRNRADKDKKPSRRETTDRSSTDRVRNVPRRGPVPCNRGVPDVSVMQVFRQAIPGGSSPGPGLLEDSRIGAWSGLACRAGVLAVIVRLGRAEVAQLGGDAATRTGQASIDHHGPGSFRASDAVPTSHRTRIAIARGVGRTGLVTQDL